MFGGCSGNLSLLYTGRQRLSRAARDIRRRPEALRLDATTQHSLCRCIFALHRVRRGLCEAFAVLATALALVLA